MSATRFYFGQWVMLINETGDTGLRGRVMGPLRPARDENGPIVNVYVFAPGETVHATGLTELYANRLEALPNC